MSNTEESQDPALAFSPNDTIGRLYRKPGIILPAEPEDLTVAQVWELLHEGILVPSTTNIIGTRDKSGLLGWSAWVVAKAAIEMAIKTPDKFISRVKQNRWGAINYFKEAPIRERDFAAAQGSKVHLALELLGKNQSIEHLTLTDHEKKCVDQFKKWLDIFQPNFKYLEVTGFGTTKDDKLQYAHTTDFIAEINKQTVIGDYKCVVDNTPILLPDGSTKPAIEIEEGDEVVAWDQVSGLHTALVSFAGDNGYHQVATVKTASGHTVTTTLNHPFYSSRKSKQTGWVPASELKIGDELYIAAGWNYAQYRQSYDWPYRKNLSPYLLGLLWSLRNYSKQNWREEHLIELPNISRDGLRQELKEIGFQFNRAGLLNTVKGFAKIARKNGIEVEDLLDLIDTPEIPKFVYGAPKNHINAFFTGIKEVFANKELFEEELVVVLNREALYNLHQLFINYGQPATIQMDPRSEKSYLKVPFEDDHTIYAYGTSTSRIVSIEITENEHHTVAIEVQGSHTHVTGGLITHNTNRSGLHADVALQLAANARGDELTSDNINLSPMVNIDGAVAVHVAPDGVTTQRVDIGDEVYDTFQSLRRAWNFHVFDGKYSNFKNGVFLGEIKTPEEL